jgi:hypothetical protein
MMSDNDFSQTETLLRQRLAQLADHAPAAVPMADEVARNRGRRAGLIAAVTALIGAGGFTTYSFLGAANNGGAATPEEAVTAFVSAIEHEDILGMIDVTVPEEVGVLRNTVETATADAKRMHVLADGFSTSGVQGVDISFDDVQLETTVIDDDLATVTASAGTFNAAFDPRMFPFGDKARALLTGDETAGKVSANLAGSTPVRLATVRRSGRWYVSLEYTAAEYIRDANGWDSPLPVARTAVGADSPEAAVNGFYERLAAFDLQGAMDTFAPGEDAMAWLAPMWLPNAQAGADKAHANGWSVTIAGVTYETIGSGDHLTMKPLTFVAEGTVPADFRSSSDTPADPSLPTLIVSSDGSQYALVAPGQVPATTEGLEMSTFPQVEGETNFTSANPDGTIQPLVFPTPSIGDLQSFKIERSGNCTTFTGTGAEAMFGEFYSAQSQAKQVDGGTQFCGNSESLGGLSVLLLTDGGLSNLPAVSVVQVGGKWYVSPLGTALSTLTTSLHGLSAADSLFDSTVGIYLYGTNRSLLESMVRGSSAGSLDVACLPALTVDNGTVTGVVADPQPAAVRACWSQFSSNGSVMTANGTTVSGPAPIGAPTATTEPAATVAPVETVP